VTHSIGSVYWAVDPKFLVDVVEESGDEEMGSKANDASDGGLRSLCWGLGKGGVWFVGSCVFDCC